jgi:hypothetical protein
MSFNSYGQYDNVFPILNPVDLGTTAVNLPSVNLKNAHRVAFLVQQGVTTPNATSDICDITVVAATAEGAVTQTAIAGYYRKSTGVAANAWGAITAFTATGVELTDDDEGFSLWIEIDANTLAANDYQVLHLNVEMNGFTAFFLSATAFIDTVYKMTTMTTATACASA